MNLVPEFDDAIAVLQVSKSEQEHAVVAMAQVVSDCFQRGGKLLICGNGGSAADSQHMAAELVSSFMAGLARPALPAIALTTDTSILTAYSNDFGYEQVFARQVEALGAPGDCLLAISTSGNSQSVIRAAEVARAQELKVLALTGQQPNALVESADQAVCIPSSDTQAIQTAHLVVEHAICRMVESAILNSSRSAESKEEYS